MRLSKEERRLRKIAYLRVWRRKNPEKSRATIARWRKLHPEWRQTLTPAQKKRKAETTSAWRALHPEKAFEYAENQRKKGAFKGGPMKAKNARRRAIKNRAIHPSSDMDAVSKVYALCAELNQGEGVEMEVDHIIPLQHGGFHHHLNLQVITQHINRKKGCDPFYEHAYLPMQTRSVQSWRDVPEYLWPEQLKDQYNALK